MCSLKFHCRIAALCGKIKKEDEKGAPSSFVKFQFKNERNH